MILEKLKAGTSNTRMVDFCGVTLKLRLLSEAEIQQCRVESQSYAKKKELDEENEAIENALRQLFVALSDQEGNRCAENIDSFRKLLTRVDREYLVEEYLLLEKDSWPSLPGMERPEFEEILEAVKKSPDSVLNSSNTSTLRRLIGYLESRRQS